MDKTIINYANFDASKIYSLSPETKQSKQKTPTEPVITYYEISLQHNYGTTESPKVESF